jgi:site-specific DNA-methyltransferase (adenine-specific)
VLDHFLGSGSTAVAAVRTERRYVGYDTDPTYMEVARERVERERDAKGHRGLERSSSPVVVPKTSGTQDFQSRCAEEGKAAQALAIDILTAAGFDVVEKDRRIPGVGILVNVVAEDADGERWYFDVTGAFTSTRGGLLRTDTLWKCLGRASVLKTCGIRPVVLLSSHLPPRRSTGDQALRKVGPAGVHDIMGMLADSDRGRLAAYAAGGHCSRPLPGFWSPSDLGPGR